MALAFNGTTQYASNSSAAVADSTMSMSVWFYPTSNSSTGFIVAVSSFTDVTADVGTMRGLRLRGDVGGDPISAQHGGAGIAYTSTGYSINTWQHAAGTFTNGTSRSVYINGGSKGSNSTSVTNRTAAETYIGAVGNFNVIGGYFPGRIAEVGIWNVVLTDAEVAILAKGVSPLMVRPGSLVFYAPLIGRNSPEVDAVGGLSMTLYNTPTTAVHPRVLYPVSPWVPSLSATPAPSGGTIPVIYHHLQQQGIG